MNISCGRCLPSNNRMNLTARFAVRRLSWTLGVNRMTLRTQAKHLYRWLRALLSWLSEARHFWLAVVVVVVAMLLVARKGVTEPEIRIAGLVLQILGIGTVAWGIRETRECGTPLSNSVDTC